MNRLSTTLQAWHQRRGCCLVSAGIPLLCIIVYGLGYVLFPPPPVDILILGMDTRPDQTHIAQTDSIILLNITPAEAQITLFSIPRDVFINIPHLGARRINSIYVLGESAQSGTGPDLLSESITTSFGVEIDHYIQLNFESFIALVDAVGGVEIDVPHQLIDPAYPTPDGGTMHVEFAPGNQIMNGERALQYARTRHPDSDFDRATRQQQVIDAIINQLRQPQNILHWARVWQIIQSETDTTLTIGDIIRFAPALVVGWPNREQRVLQPDELTALRAGYRIPQYDKLLPWIEEHFD